MTAAQQQPTEVPRMVRPTRCSKRPSSKVAASEEVRRTLRYVESLSDARTPLADFFSIGLELHLNEIGSNHFGSQLPAGIKIGDHDGLPELSVRFRHPIDSNRQSPTSRFDEDSITFFDQQRKLQECGAQRSIWRKRPRGALSYDLALVCNEGMVHLLNPQSDSLEISHID